MYEVYLIATMACSDAADIISRIKNHDDMDNFIKDELVVTVKEATPHCSWDAND